MKNTGFGQLRKRLFTIKKPLKCRFRGPNIYIYMYILHSVHISATFVDRPRSPCMTRTKTSASRKFVEPWPTVFFSHKMFGSHLSNEKHYGYCNCCIYGNYTTQLDGDHHKLLQGPLSTKQYNGKS